jgi:hypothetical protein
VRAGVFAQPGNAACAVVTAHSTSSSRQRGAWPIVERSAGFSTGNVSCVRGAQSLPPITTLPDSLPAAVSASARGDVVEVVAAAGSGSG